MIRTAKPVQGVQENLHHPLKFQRQLRKQIPVLKKLFLLEKWKMDLKQTWFSLPLNLLQKMKQVQKQLLISKQSSLA